MSRWWSALDSNPIKMDECRADKICLVRAATNNGKILKTGIALAHSTLCFFPSDQPPPTLLDQVKSGTSIFLLAVPLTLDNIYQGARIQDLTSMSSIPNTLSIALLQRLQVLRRTLIKLHRPTPMSRL